MFTISDNEREYKVVFDFDAAEEKTIVQRMFDYVTGAYMFESNNALQGTGAMVADVPQTCIDAIYAGCLSENPVTPAQAKVLARKWISDHEGASYRTLFEEIKKSMEDDGFFTLSGLEQATKEMVEALKNLAEQQTEEKKPAKRKVSTK